VLSLVLMTVSVHEVGATPTAIMGALEPLTAVAIGVLVFGESLTVRLVIGI
jgi:drug/metabolite transporter (DMT)-like permease